MRELMGISARVNRVIPLSRCWMHIEILVRVDNLSLSYIGYVKHVREEVVQHATMPLLCQ